MVVVVAALVVAFTSLGGSTGKSPGSSVTAAAKGGKARSRAHRPASSKAGSQAGSHLETIVTVLNGTEQTGLAHHVAAELQQNGYSQSQALSGRPPGVNQVTVVEYASGHQAEGESVARSLSVTQVQPLETAVASLAGSAAVVVIVGADRAATVQ